MAESVCAPFMVSNSDDMLNMVIKTIHADVIRVMKRIGNASTTNDWYVYCFQPYKYDSAKAYIIHRFNDKFNDRTLVQAFTIITDSIARADDKQLELISSIA